MTWRGNLLNSPSPEHEIAAAALATIRCKCGWAFFNHALKGKSDEDLAAEAMAAFDEHRRG